MTSLPRHGKVCEERNAGRALPAGLEHGGIPGDQGRARDVLVELLGTGTIYPFDWYTYIWPSWRRGWPLSASTASGRHGRRRIPKSTTTTWITRLTTTTTTSCHSRDCS